jgi:DMSO/TMAO reductase YedYZ molybdopterin-dependent catalytic subunit
LPPGQRARADFPRFGIWTYASRFPANVTQRSLEISGDAVLPFTLADAMEGLPRVEQVSDLHCVTTWTHRGVRWGGVRFAAWYAAHVAPRVQPDRLPSTVVLRAQDRGRTVMLLEDLLADDVLLADELNGAPLTVAHGAPLRLVAPAHYAYKSIKYLSRLEFWHAVPRVRPAAFAFMDHPRARVWREERGRGVPGVLLRALYRPLIGVTVRVQARALLAWASSQTADAGRRP